jgi:hypothetical protein
MVVSEMVCRIPNSLLSHSILWTLCTEYIELLQRTNSWKKWGQKYWEFSSLLFTVTPTNGFYSPSPLSKCGSKRVCNVNKVYGTSSLKTLKIMAQKSQRNCTLMNSASDLWYSTVEYSIMEWPVAKFLVPDWGNWPTLVWGCRRTGPPAYRLHSLTGRYDLWLR